MEHVHDYETVERHAVTKDANEAGIESVETRRCKDCGSEMLFVLSHGKWIELFDDSSRSEKDILLA